ncbi:hypothetical protein RRG08_050216 [Elysia crispata]|uniref:Uncharacterized protein n=1 Tax=Elysia crispata TaxID=231223 RepID=A0AAE0Z6T6_9GAST|nr:hypothetical protein RRG08_050216 [Elysia crispata]
MRCLYRDIFGAHFLIKLILMLGWTSKAHQRPYTVLLLVTIQVAVTPQTVTDHWEQGQSSLSFWYAARMRRLTKRLLPHGR